MRPMGAAGEVVDTKRCYGGVYNGGRATVTETMEAEAAEVFTIDGKCGSSE